jgi:DNA-binding CsgD family transcriptional regulator
MNLQLYNELPGLCVWKKDCHSRFLDMNHAFAALLGFKSPDQAIGKSDYELPSRLSESAEVFIAHDINVITQRKTVQYIEFGPYANNEYKMLYVVKTPFSEKNGVGTLGYCTDITNAYKVFLDLFDIDNRQENLQKSFILAKGYNGISKREIECLFFLIRGKTAKNIAKQLGISYRTVEHYIQSLRLKFNCESKVQLIEAAIAQGFDKIIPESIFNKKNSIIIE